jgi:hypothetical protein
MSFNWENYLSLARILHNRCVCDHGTPDEEACFRAAISRSYYSAFCVARNFARDRDGVILNNSASDHWLIINHYKEFRGSNRRKKNKIALILQRLRRSRGLADYEDRTPSKLEETTKEALKSEEEVISLLNSMCNS